MNDPLTVEPGVETQAAAQQRGLPAAAPRPWVQPVFERVRLNEALSPYTVGSIPDGLFTYSS